MNALLRKGLLYLLLMMAALSGHALDEAAVALPGIDKVCIDEPVFGESACIYQANVAAAKTVVLVHGLNGRAMADWGNQIPALAEHYHVLAFDLPGFGDSGKAVADYSPQKYARFIRYITERYAHGPVDLVGHSMGGAIALRYAATYPEQVEKLVLIDVAGVLHRMAYARQLARGWMHSIAGDESWVPSFADRMTNKLLGKVEPVTGPLTEFMAQQLLRRELLNVDPAVISAMTLVNEDLSDALPKIEMPTLIIWGQDDLVAPRRTAQVLLHYIPDAQLEVIAGAAHVPMVQQPERFNRLFLAYLAAHYEHAAVLPAQQQPVNDSPQYASCRKESGVSYEGYYASLTLDGCSQVVIKNATIRELIIRSSQVSIEQSEIVSDTVAMRVESSDVVITASRLRGQTAIYTSGSRLDLAAVKLSGSKNAVTGGRSSSLVFSVSEIDSPLARRSIHEFVKVDKKHPL
jgi:pimeloyl-ACP methyl ester carboxylesterase